MSTESVIPRRANDGGPPLASLKKRRTRPARAAQPNAADPHTWPAVWRVVIPAAGSFDHDMVMCETEDEKKARSAFKSFRQSRYTVRLELVRCGPLPKGYMDSLRMLRTGSPQNPDTELRPVLGAWTNQERAS